MEWECAEEAQRRSTECAVEWEDSHDVPGILPQVAGAQVTVTGACVTGG